jgi:hypothetical protein
MKIRTIQQRRTKPPRVYTRKERQCQKAGLLTRHSDRKDGCSLPYRQAMFWPLVPSSHMVRVGSEISGTSGHEKLMTRGQMMRLKRKEVDQ